LAPGCASDDKTVEKIVPQLSAEEAADSALHASLRLMSTVHAVYADVKDELETNQFALVDGVTEALKDEPDTLRDLHNELDAQLEDSGEDKLTSNVVKQLYLFEELMASPHSKIGQGRLANYADDIDSPYWLLDIILNGDQTDDVKKAYYFSPAYNLLASTHILALATIHASKFEIERFYKDVIATNQHLVGDADEKDQGRLHDFVSARIEGGYDTDPVVYVIRRSLDEEQRAIE
jgi:hypothetical protein